MPASERVPKDWKFRVLGRVVFQFPRRVVYLIVLGLSIGVGLHSPGAVLNFAEGVFHKLLREFHEWRALADGIAKRFMPAGNTMKKSSSSHQAPQGGGTGVAGDEPGLQRLPPHIHEPLWQRKRTKRAICYADAERLHGHSLRLREAPCSTSPHVRSVEAGSGGIWLTGRHTRCLKHGVWWIWSEVIYRNEYLWAARHYLQCHA